MNIDTNGFEIEDIVEDRVTGLKGQIIGITQWQTGCSRAAIQQKVGADGKVPETWAVDVLTLKMVKAGPRHTKPVASASIGGPAPVPQRYPAVRR